MSGFDGGNPYGANYSTGGGFMAGGEDSPSTKKSGSNSLRPVTIRQILNAQQPAAEGDFTIDGVQLGQLTFVGVVRNVSSFPTNVSYSVEDGTGSIDVRQWLDGNADETGKTDGITQNRYIRVLGTIKAFQNKVSISAGHIRPITDFDEVIFHKLEAINTHLQLLNGAGASSGAPRAAAGGAEQKFSHIEDPLQRKVMESIASLADAHEGSGVPIVTVARRIAGYKEQDVRTAVENLVTEGYLFTAEDDEHVLPS